jgi:hypothetical protein
VRGDSQVHDRARMMALTFSGEGLVVLAVASSLSAALFVERRIGRRVGHNASGHDQARIIKQIPMTRVTPIPDRFRAIRNARRRRTKKHIDPAIFPRFPIGRFVCFTLDHSAEELAGRVVLDVRWRKDELSEGCWGFACCGHVRFCLGATVEVTASVLSASKQLFENQTKTH